MLSVGNHLHETKGGTILTDNTRKKYRRMSIVDDRLVGYLSLGPTQPDALAIKRIIDEGLSIRGTEDALLKGKFDARKYFSQHRSRAVKDMVTSGKIPIVIPSQYALPPSAVHPVVDRPIKSTPQANELIAGQSAFSQSKTGATFQIETPKTEPLHNAVSERSRMVDQPTIHQWEKEGEPTTDRLLEVSKKTVESIMIHLPSRPLPHTLRSYSAKLPRVTTQQSSSGHPDTGETETASHNEQPGHTNFLL